MTHTYACQTVGDLTALLAILPSDMKVRTEVKTDAAPGGVRSLLGDLQHIVVCQADDDSAATWRSGRAPGCVILTGE